MEAALETVLRVRDLVVAARDHNARHGILNSVNLDLAKGEILGIVGESGSGKSTLCRAIARILPDELAVESGSIELEGRDLLAMSAAQVHRLAPDGVGMVFQEPRVALNPLMRIGDQIVEALRAREQLSRRAARVRAVELLERMGIANATRRLEDHMHQLSGGQCQRIVMAIALAGDPGVLLADEPTSALDVSTQAQLLELLREVATERRMSVVLVSHNYAVIAQVCSRVIVMYAGGVLEVGPTTELLLNPRHPYTAALIASLPDLDRRAQRLAVIPGRAPAAGEVVAGCSFNPRCAHAQDACRTTQMQLAPVAAEHATACIRAGEIWPNATARPDSTVPSGADE